ncbi:hypothetical protein ES708_22761 [subsurface metagenome]
MKKLIILIEIIILILLIYIAIPKQGNGKEPKYFIMTSTAYSRHPNCIAPKYDDGFTATMTPVREGVVAINVDWIDGRWQVRSPLKLGQKIYIKGIGYFSVEDTGYFTEKNLHFDFWNLDIYKEDYEKAKKWGIEPVEVYVLEDKQ